MNRLLNRLVAVVVSMAVGLLVAGCASSETPDAAPSITTTSAVAEPPIGGGSASGPNPAGDCPMTTPGVLLAEAEAIVKFAADRVCPGYLTLAPGTEVRFRNEAAVAANVTVTFGDEPDTEPLFREALESGQVAFVEVNEPGFYQYRISVIPSFVGTLEVLEG